MFTLGKLLSETPEKITNTILALIKLILTLWLASKFGSPFLTKDFELDSILNNIDPFGALYYLVCATAIWFLLWGIVIQLFFDLIIGLLSLLISNERALEIYLTLIGAAKFDDNGNLVKTNPNIHWFTDSLENQDKNPFIITFKFNEILSISILTMIFLMSSGHIKSLTWQFWIASFFLFSFSILAVLQEKWSSYYSSHAPVLRARFFYIGKRQMLLDAIKLAGIIPTSYELKIKRKFFELSKKDDSKLDYLPCNLIIRTVFISDEFIGKKVIKEVEASISSKNETVHNQFTIVATNITNFDDEIHFLNQEIVFLSANNIDQMYNRMSDLIYVLRKNYYSNLMNEDPTEE